MSILTTPTTPVEEVVAAGPPEELLEGWFCIATDPWPCPADGCPFVANFVTAAHLIVIWDEADDPNLLQHAAIARDAGRNPRVIPYEASFGYPIPYYTWEAIGRPVHAVRRDAGS